MHVQLPTQSVPSGYFAERGRPHVIKWEVLPVHDGEVLELTFERVGGNGRHGVWIAAEPWVEVDGQLAPSVDLWQERRPQRSS